MVRTTDILAAIFPNPRRRTYRNVACKQRCTSSTYSVTSLEANTPLSLLRRRSNPSACTKEVSVRCQMLYSTQAVPKTRTQWPQITVYSIIMELPVPS